MVSELRQKFEDYLIYHRLAKKTQAAYLGAVASLARHYRQSPEKLTNEQVQQYLLHLLRQRKLSWSSCNVTFSGLCCFYKKFLNRAPTELNIPPRPRQKILPETLSRQEVKTLIEAAADIRSRALLMITYGSGLRVSETVHLMPEHIESDRMLVRVEQGKGRKDRYTLLSQTSLEELRIYYKALRPETWLFFGRSKKDPMGVKTAQQIYNRAKKKAGITKGKGIHTLRHCFATHLLEQGTDIYLIKRYLGHLSFQTTTVYLHLLPDRLSQVKSPLDSI